MRCIQVVTLTLLNKKITLHRSYQFVCTLLWWILPAGEEEMWTWALRFLALIVQLISCQTSLSSWLKAVHRQVQISSRVLFSFIICLFSEVKEDNTDITGGTDGSSYECLFRVHVAKRAHLPGDVPPPTVAASYNNTYYAGQPVVWCLWASSAAGVV